MVIEVPEELREFGEAMAAALATVQGTRARTGGGKAVDYAAVERAMAEEAEGIERAGHRAILQALDIDVPTVVIGGIRYNRVGRCEAPYHTLAGSVSIERSLYRQSGQRGGQPGGRVVDPVSLRAGVVGDGWLPRTARAMAHTVQQGTSRGNFSINPGGARVVPPGCLIGCGLRQMAGRVRVPDVAAGRVAGWHRGDSFASAAVFAWQGNAVRASVASRAVPLTPVPAPTALRTVPGTGVLDNVV